MREDRKTKAELINELIELRKQVAEYKSLETRLHVLNEALTANEERLSMLLENSQDVIYRMKLNPEWSIEYVSPSVTSITGYTPYEFLTDQKLLIKAIHPDDQAQLKNIDPKRAGQLQKSILRFVRRDGEIRWIEHTIRTVCGENQDSLTIEGIATDITEKKALTDKISYLDLHDPLTGFYNRPCFESFITRFEKEKALAVGIVVCDVDGLKLVNDTLGRKVGDALLLTTANLLKQCFGSDQILSRVGGDEFAIICPGFTRTELDSDIHQLQNSITEYNRINHEMSLSISIGAAVRAGGLPSMNDLYKEADNNMYREKLHRKQSTRNALVQTLMAALEARDFITEGHADRLQGLVALVAIGIGLPEHIAADLRLLAQFHDIGKVGIPDRILFKPGPFDKDELEEMRRHCQIGHRIALSTPDLAPVADWILKHHEWWNGEGYPLGIRGDSIPLPCRILSIADAYDAMTSDRPYRKAMSHYEAATELNRCAGTQFDPAMVDLFLQVLNSSTTSKQLPS